MVSVIHILCFASSLYYDAFYYAEQMWTKKKLNTFTSNSNIFFYIKTMCSFEKKTNNNKKKH